MAEAALRPRTVPEVLDATFNLLRRDYLKYLTIMAIVNLPNMLLTAFWMQSAFSSIALSDDSEMAMATMGAGGMIVPFISWLVFFPFIDAALSAAAADAYMGREISVGGTLRLLGKRFGTLIVVAIFRGLAMVLGLVLLVLPGVYAFLHYLLAPVVAMVEEKKGGETLARSGDLSRGYKGKLFLAMFALYFINICLSMLPSIAAMVVNNATVLTVVTILVTLFFHPMFPVASTVLYYDARIRKEGFDLELLAQDLDKPAGQPAV